jgi:outer membrane receptor protein involved in Fe transport
MKLLFNLSLLLFLSIYTFNGFSQSASKKDTTKTKVKPADSTIINLKEVSIQSRQPVIQEKADRTVVDVEKMNTTGDNALDVLKRAPGIKLDKDENIVLKGRTGINIMIDGKMTYMTGIQLTTYLKSLPATVLSKIELMSSPPSSFDAAGSAGIINIKLKRNRIKGVNGNANLGGGYGKYEKVNGGVNLNYNTGKVSTYLRLNAGHYNSYNRLVLNRTIDDMQFNQVNLWRPITNSTWYTTGADYFANDRHTFGVMIKGDGSPYKSNSYSNSLSYDKNGNVTGKVNALNPQKNTSNNHAYNLNYRFNVDSSGRELGFDADYVAYNNSRDEHFTNTYYNGNDVSLGDPVQLRNYSSGDVSIYALKLDYVHPFSKSLKAEVGLKTSWVTTKSDARFDSLKTFGWVNAANRTNTFVYHEHINAAYISLSKSFKNIELKGGVRAEQTLGDGTSSSTNVLIDRKYWQLFPTLFATWKLDSINLINAKFSRRINRPSYSSLNPFVMYSDPYTAIKGNPFLLPSYSNNIELTYSFKNFRVLSFNVSRTTNVISEVITQNDVTKESISSPKNLSKSTSVYLATGSPFDVTKWWNTNNELAGSYDALKSPVQGSDYNFSRFSWSVSSDNTFTLPKDFQLSLTGNYSSPSINGLFRSLAYYQVDLGAKKTFMNKKATISFKLNDVFNTAKFRAFLKYNNVNTYWQNEWESRKFSLNLSLKFGNMKIKTARNRKTGTAEEQGRVTN